MSMRNAHTEGNSLIVFGCFVKLSIWTLNHTVITLFGCVCISALKMEYFEKEIQFVSISVFNEW